MSDIASPPLVTRYLRYKRGTQKVVTWLLRAARYVQKSEGVEMYRGTESKIPPRQLLDFAKLVSAAKTPIIVPPGVLILAEDVIEGRKQCAEYYTRMEETDKAGRNTSHQSGTHRHLIAILEEVTSLLKDAAKPSKISGTRKAKKVRGTDSSLASTSLSIRMSTLRHPLCDESQ